MERVLILVMVKKVFPYYEENDVESSTESIHFTESIHRPTDLYTQLYTIVSSPISVY